MAAARRHFLLSAAALLAPCAARADEFPSRPIRLIVPFAPGGPTDLAARAAAEALAQPLGQPVVIENRPGAGGNIGAEAAARAPADGYTLLWAQSATHGINPSVYRQLGYDALRDFAPVGLVSSEPLVLVTHPAAPWSDVAALLAAAAGPSPVHFASGGIGSTPHLAGELLAKAAGITLVHVPYRGNALAVPDVIAGRVPLLFDGVNAALGHIRAGRLRPLAVTTENPVALLPDIPTIASTVPGYHVRSWGGIVAPAATPRPIVARLAAALTAIGGQPGLRARYSERGVDLEISTPEAMNRFMRAEIARWGAVITQIGLQPE